MSCIYGKEYLVQKVKEHIAAQGAGFLDDASWCASAVAKVEAETTLSLTLSTTGFDVQYYFPQLHGLREAARILAEDDTLIEAVILPKFDFYYILDGDSILGPHNSYAFYGGYVWQSQFDYAKPYSIAPAMYAKLGAPTLYTKWGSTFPNSRAAHKIFQYCGVDGIVAADTPSGVAMNPVGRHGFAATADLMISDIAQYFTPDGRWYQVWSNADALIDRTIRVVQKDDDDNIMDEIIDALRLQGSLDYRFGWSGALPNASHFKTHAEWRLA